MHGAVNVPQHVVTQAANVFEPGRVRRGLLHSADQLHCILGQRHLHLLSADSTDVPCMALQVAAAYSMHVLGFHA
jgi:hypothetical protein